MNKAPQFPTEEAPVEGVDRQIPRQPGAHNLAPQFMAPPAPEHDDYEDGGVDVGYLTNDGMFHVGNPEEPEPAEPRTTDPPVLQLRTARKEARKQQLADNAAAEPATPKLKAPKSAKKAAASTSEEPQADTTEPETTAPKAAKKGDNKGKGHKNGKGTAEAAPVAVKTAEQEKTDRRNGVLARVATGYLKYREAKSATAETTKEERRKKVAAKVGQATVQKETEITPKVDTKGIRQALTVEQASMLSRKESKLVREELAQQRLINGLTKAELKERLEKSGYFKVNNANVKR